ncbi:MFS transporter [Gordonia soli]|nr:MFS transporter [Gordonia soli]
MVVRRFPVAGLWLVFFVNGAVLASWAPRIPDVAERLGTSDAALGGALFGVAAGSIPALMATARLLATVSAHVVCVASAVVFVIALPAISVVGEVMWLAAVLAVLGAASGCLDVAMNAAAVRFQCERRSGGGESRSVLSRLHGGYSLGVVVGAAGATLATAVEVPVREHFLTVTAVLLALVAVAASQLPRLPADVSAVGAGPSTVRAVLALPAAIVAVAIAGLLVEGMVTDWSALAIARDFGAGAAVGSATLAGFSVAMFVSRSVGDRLIDRFGRRRVLVGGAAVVGAALAVGMSQSSAPVAVACVVIVGLGLGPVFPLAMSAAADNASPTSVAAATAAISAVGYLAYLAGPPMIGVVAEHAGLTATIGGVGLGCAVIIGACGRSRALG